MIFQLAPTYRPPDLSLSLPPALFMFVCYSPGTTLDCAGTAAYITAWQKWPCPQTLYGYRTSLFTMGKFGLKTKLSQAAGRNLIHIIQLLAINLTWRVTPLLHQSPVVCH